MPPLFRLDIVLNNVINYNIEPGLRSIYAMLPHEVLIIYIRMVLTFVRN